MRRKHFIKHTKVQTALSASAALIIEERSQKDIDRNNVFEKTQNALLELVLATFRSRSSICSVNTFFERSATHHRS